MTSITIEDGGAGYVVAPFVSIRNSRQDPNGAADPSLHSGSGYWLTGTNPTLQIDGTACPTSPVSIFCATSGARFAVKWMT